MQFKVPQFLEIEDKIFGPFTFREFVYIAGGAGMCFVLYKVLGLLFGAIPILIVGGFAAALTFYKPNNKPFITMLESVFKFGIQSKLYIWERHKSTGEKVPDTRQEKIDAAKTQALAQNGTRFGGSKLRDLAWSLDVMDLKK